MSKFSAAVYPGTFDPVTNGHIDIITRAARLVDRLVVAVAVNIGKDPLFTLEERVAMVEAEVEAMGDGHSERVFAVPFDTLLMDFVRDQDAGMIIRGLRAVSDFEYEFQMAQMNRHLDSELETIFLMPNEKYFYTSSSLIKQVHLFGDRETGLVPPNVSQALSELAKNKSL